MDACATNASTMLGVPVMEVHRTARAFARSVSGVSHQPRKVDVRMVVRTEKEWSDTIP